MYITGTGSRDSPIAFHDDSEDEIISVLAHQDNSYNPPSDDLLLSPRPGTFLSAVPRPHRFVVPAGMPKQEALQQSLKRKRVEAITPSKNLPATVIMSGTVQPMKGAPEGEPQQGSRKQRKLRLKLERERLAAEQELRAKVKGKQTIPNGGISSVPPIRCAQNQSTKKLFPDAPQAKRAKQNKTPNGPFSSVDQTSSTPGPIQGPPSLRPASTSRESQILRPPMSHPLGQASQPTSMLVHNGFPPAPSYTGVASLPPRPDMLQVPLDPFVGQSSTMSALPPQFHCGLEFDPLFPWLYTSMGHFSPTSSLNPMHMQSMSMAEPFMNQTASLLNPAPQKIPHQKATSGVKQKGSKAKSNRQLLPNQILQNPERAFTIRVLDRNSERLDHPYVPIGKPDFHFKHGVFPIIPSIMHLQDSNTLSTSTSTKQPTRNLYVPNLESTLVLENIPKSMCNISWVERWCIDTTAVKPKRILLCPRRALVEFREHDEAVAAWMSSKLGVDQVGHRLPEGEGGGAQGIIAFWYRPDLEQEKGLVELWKHSKKVMSEVLSVVQTKDEGVVMKALDETLLAMREKSKPEEKEEGEVEEDNGHAIVAQVIGIEVASFSLELPYSGDVKGDFRKFAEKLGFWKKLMNVVGAGMNDDALLFWEQLEIAKIDRVRSIIHSKLHNQTWRPDERKRKPNDDDEEMDLDVEDERKRKRARQADGKDVTMLQPSAPALGTSRGIPKSSMSSISQPSSHPSTFSSIRLPPNSATAKPQASTVSPPNTNGIFSALDPSKPRLPSKPILPPLSIPGQSTKPAKSAQAAGNPNRFPSTSGTISSALPIKPAAPTWTTSSVLKLPTRFGLSLSIPSASFSGQSGLSAPSAVSQATPVHQLSTNLPRADTDSTSVSPIESSSSSSQVTPILRPSPLSTSRRKEDVVVKPSTVAGNNPGKQSGPCAIQPSTASSAVISKEDHVSWGDRTVQRLEMATATTSASVDTKTSSVHQEKGSNAPMSNDVSTAISPWKIGMKGLTEGLRAVGRQLLHRDSFCLPANMPPTTADPMVTSVSAPPPLVLFEPSAPQMVIPQTTDEKDGYIDPDRSMDMDISPILESVERFPSQDPPEDTASKENFPQQVTVTSISTALSISTLTPTLPPPSSVKDPNLSLKTSKELFKVLLQSKDERQKFLDREFKVTKALLDKLVNATCRNEKKRITALWKEKIRVLDEVTTSLRNESSIWYSPLAQSWVRFRWPETPDGAGVLELSDDDEDY